MVRKNKMVRSRKNERGFGEYYSAFKRNNKIKITLLAIFTVLSLGIVFWSFYSLPDQEEEEQSEPKIPGKIEDFEKAIAGMKETSDQMMNWSILILGGTMAITITSQSIKLKDDNAGLIFMGPIWVFLVASLYFASSFKQILTYQIANAEYEFAPLNDYLYLQVAFFHYSIAPIGALALWYLVHRILLL